MQENFNINEISLEGYQVVRGLYFSRIIEPSCSLWYSSIAFNTAAFQALNNCEAISILVNSEARSLIVKPVPTKDRDAIKWLRPNDNQKYKKIECSKFAHQLFDMWGWDKELHCRANGRLVKADKKIMLLFDFTKPELWHGLKMVSEFE
jgi:hypothetical protein